MVLTITACHRRFSTCASCSVVAVVKRLGIVFPQGPSGVLHGANSCRALLRPSRESKSPHLRRCALSVISERPENTGLIFHRKHYSKNPIASHVRTVTSEEFLPGVGKIFTMAAPRLIGSSEVPIKERLRFQRKPPVRNGLAEHM